MQCSNLGDWPGCAEQESSVKKKKKKGCVKLWDFCVFIIT